MSGAARSVAVWAGYTFGVGLLLLVVPSFLLGLFRIEETDESWIRVLGAMVLLLAFYYLAMAVTGAKVLFRATVYGRGAVAVALAVAEQVVPGNCFCKQIIKRLQFAQSTQSHYV